MPRLWQSILASGFTMTVAHVVDVLHPPLGGRMTPRVRPMLSTEEPQVRDHPELLKEMCGIRGAARHLFESWDEDGE